MQSHVSALVYVAAGRADSDSLREAVRGFLHGGAGEAERLRAGDHRGPARAKTRVMPRKSGTR